jgi:hypothetical protein
MRRRVLRDPIAVLLSVSTLGLFGGCSGGSERTAVTQAKPPTPALALPVLAEGEKCPVSSERSISPEFGPALGDGPVYPVGVPHGLLQFIYPAEETQVWYPSDWGGQKVLWVADPKYHGPILIRGGRIDTPGRLGFGERSEPDWAMSLGSSGGDGSWRQFPSYTRLKAPGCYAYQVDGDGFQTTIVFEAAVFS